MGLGFPSVNQEDIKMRTPGRGKQVVIYGTPQLLEMLDRYAAAWNMSRQQWVTEALRGLLEERMEELKARELDNQRWGMD